MEKRRKELMFLLVGVAILALALYATFKPKARPASAEVPAKTAAAAQQTSEAAPPGVDSASAMPAQADQAATSAEQATAKGKPGRDPFVSSVAAPPRVLPVSGPPTILLGKQFASAGSLAPASISVMPLPGMGQLPAVQPAPAGQQPPGAAQLQDNRLRVTGIVYGDPTVAILRKGAARWVVQSGDSAGPYVVESISGRRVVLAAGGERISLFLEGRL